MRYQWNLIFLRPIEGNCQPYDRGGSTKQWLSVDVALFCESNMHLYGHIHDGLSKQGNRANFLLNCDNLQIPNAPAERGIFLLCTTGPLPICTTKLIPPKRLRYANHPMLNTKRKHESQPTSTEKPTGQEEHRPPLRRSRTRRGQSTLPRPPSHHERAQRRA
jgi:hypothetical protein